MLKLIFSANLTKDCVKRYTGNGDVVLDVFMAVNDWNGKEKVTIWIKGSLWGKRGESLEQYLLVGTKVMVEGKLQHHEGNPRTWGENPVRASFEVMITDIELIGGKKQEEDTAF
jgi:single-strand DNA-binding protein